MPMLLSEAVCSMPLSRIQASEPSLPSLTWTTIWCRAAEWARMLSMHRRKCARLFQVGIRIENIAPVSGGEKRLGGDHPAAHAAIAQQPLVAGDEDQVVARRQQLPQHLVARV